MTGETELLRAANPGETFEDEVARTAPKRLVQQEGIAAVAAFLAGPIPAGSAARTCPPTAACCPDRRLCS